MENEDVHVHENVVTEEPQKEDFAKVSYSDVEDQEELDAIERANRNAIFPVDQMAHGCAVVGSIFVAAANQLQSSLKDALKEDNTDENTSASVESEASAESASEKNVQPSVWDTAVGMVNYAWETTKETLVSTEENLEKVSETYIAPALDKLSDTLTEDINYLSDLTKSAATAVTETFNGKVEEDTFYSPKRSTLDANLTSGEGENEDGDDGVLIGNNTSTTHPHTVEPHIDMSTPTAATEPVDMHRD